MNRYVLVLFLTVLLGTSCASTGQTTTDEELSGVRSLRRCQFQALNFSAVVAGEEFFEELQAAASAGTALSADQELAVTLLSEPLNTANARFTHMRRAQLVELGDTTLPEFREATGLLEYIDYMSNSARAATVDRTSELRQQFDQQLQMACDSRQEEFLSEACAAGDSEACRLVDNLDQLDPAIVAEACELTPYMLFCDPEDPIPWELPPLDDE